MNTKKLAYTAGVALLVYVGMQRYGSKLGGMRHGA